MPNEDQGHEHYTTRRLTFSRPFTLGTSPEVYPAGTYEVETKQAACDASGRSVLRRISTVLVVPTPTGTLHRQVSGIESPQQWPLISGHSTFRCHSLSKARLVQSGAPPEHRR
jgi:hypothetical protein